MREGLRLLLSRDQELEIVGEAANGQEALAQVRLLQPDLIVMDLMLAGQEGMVSLMALREECQQSGWWSSRTWVIGPMLIT